MTRSMRMTLLSLAILAVATGILVVSGRPTVKSEAIEAREYQDRLAALHQQLQGRVGSQVPDLRFRLISDDSERRLSEFRGRVVILNLWHTGCGPCWTEMPALEAVQAKFGDELAVITLTPEFPSRVRQVLEKKAATLPPLSGYTKRYEWLPNQIIPISLFVDRGGVIRDFAVGKRSQQEFEKTLAPHL